MKKDTNIIDLGFQKKKPLWLKCQMDSSRARLWAEKESKWLVQKSAFVPTIGCWQWRRFSLFWKQEASAGFWWAMHKEQSLRMELNFIVLITKSRIILFYQNGNYRTVLKTSKKCSEVLQCFCSRLTFLDSANIKGDHIFLFLPFLPSRNLQHIVLYIFNTKSNAPDIC